MQLLCDVSCCDSTNKLEGYGEGCACLTTQLPLVVAMHIILQQHPICCISKLVMSYKYFLSLDVNK